MAEISLSVEYYDSGEKDLFQGFPNAEQLNSLVQTGITISKDEFLSYMMFTEQMERDGFRTYNELSIRITQRLGDIDDFISFNNGSVQSKMSSDQMMQSGFTQRIGVALGLCVINKIHALTSADWKKVLEASGRGGYPTFDFEIAIASTGNNFIQAENKGSIIDDNLYKRSMVSQHLSSIKNKKAYVRKTEAILGLPLHQNLYYGTIGVLDNRTNSIAKVWLVDPPSFDMSIEPEKYKLLARLQYYLDEFKNIGVKNKITNALEERIKQIAETQDYLQFDNISVDKDFPNTNGYYLYMEGRTFTIVDTNEAFGKVFFVEYKQVVSAYLIAFPKVIMRLIVKQDFKAILAFDYSQDFINENVQILVRLDEKNIQINKLPDNLKFVFNERRKYYEATYFGKVNHSIDGRIFGLLDNEFQNG